MTVLQIYSRSLDGHRAEYVSVISQEARSLGIEPRVLDKTTLGSAGRQPLLFAMLDEDLSAFLVQALLAPFTGRKVAGLFFRPGECFRPSLKHRIKGLVFKALKAVRAAEIVTILPPQVDPRFETVSTGWVHDPQLWDLLALTPPAQAEPSALGAEVARRADGRKVMVALGAQNRIKGFDYFSELWTRSPELRARYLFVAAGKVAPGSRVHADAFADAGGMLVDRFVSDAELHDLYGAADIIWAAYAPDYNQASGITGRAYQKGAPVCLRAGAYITDQMRALSHPLVTIGFEDAAKDAVDLLDASVSRRPPPVAEMTEMRDRFRDFLKGLVTV